MLVMRGGGGTPRSGKDFRGSGGSREASLDGAWQRAMMRISVRSMAVLGTLGKDVENCRFCDAKGSERGRGPLKKLASATATEGFRRDGRERETKVGC